MILVTGSTGFLGKSFCKTLENNDIEYGVVLRDAQKSKQGINSINVKSIDESTPWGRELSSFDTIVHIAGVAHGKALNASSYQSVNHFGTIRLAKAALEHGVKRFVFISSIGVLGSSNRSKAFENTDATDPYNDYTNSKLDAEVSLKKLAQETDLEVVIIRPTLIYGKEAPGNFSVLLRLVRLTSVSPFGLFDNSKSFISVDNLSDLIMLCCFHVRATGNIFLASDNRTLSTKELISEMGFGLGKKIHHVNVPFGLLQFLCKVFGKSRALEQLACNLEVDSSNLKSVLGWTPPYTTQKEMMKLR